MRDVNWTLAGVVAALVAGVGLCAGAVVLAGFTGVVLAHMRAEVFLLAATGGAGLAGACVHPLFGRAGWRGWVWALAGAVLATLLGAMLAGVATLRPQNMPLVAMALGFVMLSPIAPFWLALMAGVHVVARRMRGTGIGPHRSERKPG